MGKNDITLKDYLSDPRRCADLLNGSPFAGWTQRHTGFSASCSTQRNYRK